MLKLKQYFLLTAALTLLGTFSTASADFVAFSVTQKGDQIPLPRDIDSVDVKYLVNVQWGQHSGNKTRIGVLEVENNSSATSVNVTGPGGNVTYSANGNGVPVQGIEAIMTDVMHRTGRFRLVERKVLDQTLREQDLGASGRISKPSSARVGKILGAEFLFQGVVTHYETGVEKKGGGLGGLIGGSAGALLGGFAVKSSKAIIGMNFRLINAETSEIVYTDQVQVDLSESGLTFGGLGFAGGGGLGGFLSNYSKTPIGQAVIAAVHKGVFDLVKAVGSAASTGSVIKVKGSQVYLNQGSSSVSVGDKLILMQRGEELIDPDTGLSLGGEDERIGEVQVTSVKEKYSIAKPVGIKASKIRRGDKVVSQKAAAPLMYATSWTPPKDDSGLFGGSKNNTSSKSSDSNDWGMTGN